MKELKVIFNDGNRRIEGIVVDTGIRETKIKTEDGTIHTVDSDYVKLTGVKLDKEYVSKCIEEISTYYREAEIPELKRTEIDVVTEYVKKYIPEIQHNLSYSTTEEALNNVNRLSCDFEDAETKETLKKFENFIESQQKTIENLQKEILDLKTKPGIAINSPLGAICATESTDPNYPGIYIDVTDEEGVIENAVLVEYDKSIEEIKVHAWKQGKEDSIKSYKWNENQLYKIFGPKN